VVKDHEGALKKDSLFAGQHISLNHFVCGTKGRLFTSTGKTSDSEMFDGGCIFIDSTTGFIHLVLQVNLNTHETLNAIHEFVLGEVTWMKDGCSKNLTRMRNISPKCNKQVTSKQQTRLSCTSIN
jgi:hypothetical protein